MVEKLLSLPNPKACRECLKVTKRIFTILNIFVLCSQPVISTHSNSICEQYYNSLPKVATRSLRVHFSFSEHHSELWDSDSATLPKQQTRGHHLLRCQSEGGKKTKEIQNKLFSIFVEDRFRSYLVSLENHIKSPRSTFGKNITQSGV